MDAVEKILTHDALVDKFMKISICCGNNADIGFFHLPSAQRGEAGAFKYSQKLDLNIQIDPAKADQSEMDVSNHV